MIANTAQKLPDTSSNVAAHSTTSSPPDDRAADLVVKTPLKSQTPHNWTQTTQIYPLTTTPPTPGLRRTTNLSHHRQNPPHPGTMPLQHTVMYQAFREITNFIRSFATTVTIGTNSVSTRPVLRGNPQLPPPLSTHHRRIRLPKPKDSLLLNHFSEQTPTVLLSSPSNTTTSGGCTRRPKLLFGPPRRSTSRLTLWIGIN